MAISDMKGTVTTTGMMNQRPNMPKAADIKINPQLPKQEVKKAPVKQETNIVNQEVQGSSLKDQFPNASETEVILAERFKTLTAEDRSAISAVLSPSVTDALSKIVPEFAPLLEQIGTTEPNVIIPLSVAKRYASSKYGGETESDALTNFMTDMMSPEINAAGNNQMEMQQTNVPPGNEPQGLMTSPQNMETV